MYLGYLMAVAIQVLLTAISVTQDLSNYLYQVMWVEFTFVCCRWGEVPVYPEVFDATSQTRLETIH